jgi:hypothetical protein
MHEDHRRGLAVAPGRPNRAPASHKHDPFVEMYTDCAFPLGESPRFEPSCPQCPRAGKYKRYLPAIRNTYTTHFYHPLSKLRGLRPCRARSSLSRHRSPVCRAPARSLG